MPKALIAGESWVTVMTHVKGFDYFCNSNYDGGADKLISELKLDGWDVDYIPNHLVPRDFPNTAEKLSEYGVVILSDVGANSLLLHPDTFSRSIRTPNRLKLLRQWVQEGGSLLMIGGYLTFQGIDSRGRWHDTPVEDILPVDIMVTDDRVEVPEGFVPTVRMPEHIVLEGIDGEWPFFLGYNKLTPKPGASVLVSATEKDPLLAVWEVGKGKAAAFASDCAPHWGSTDFTEWKHYGRLWTRLCRWLCGEM